jgi:hypothetical protein|tara:strand:+ start:103 stop:342 length:240 start_codon:yes stop_codon:yes gene_type:complete
MGESQYRNIIILGFELLIFVKTTSNRKSKNRFVSPNPNRAKPLKEKSESRRVPNNTKGRYVINITGPYGNERVSPPETI